MEDDNVMRITAANGVGFNVRIVREGDRYGLMSSKVHDGVEPIVEFYDARFDNERHQPGLGKCVKRYAASTILERDGSRGLLLDDAIPAWRIDAASMAIVTGWVAGRLEPARAFAA